MKTCKLCGSKKIESERRTKFGSWIIHCKQCDIRFLEDFQSEYDEQLYSYYNSYKEKENRNAVKEELNKIRLRELLLKISARLGKRNDEIRFLDYGCGLGLAVEVAKGLGFKAVGIDLNRTAIEIGISQGRNVSVCDIFSSELSDQRFDIIYCSEVIEHLPEPQRVLKRITSLLISGGITYLTTPNYDCLERKILKNDWSVYDPQHYFYFNKKSLRSTLNNAGFNKAKIDCKGFNIISVLRLKITREKKGISGEHEKNRNAELKSLNRLRSFAIRNPLGRIMLTTVNGMLNTFCAGNTFYIECS